MPLSINEFQSTLRFGGARASLFEVRITNPVNGVADFDVPFKVRAAQTPGATQTKIDLPYFGRNIGISGNRTFDDWTVTVINDEDYLIRNAMESWANAINRFEQNTTSLASASPLLYKSQAQVIHYSKDGLSIREYTMYGLWPTNIAPIDLDWSNDTISEFQVTFNIDYWDSTGPGGNLGGV